MSPANLLQMAGLNPLLELCFNLLQKIKFQVRSVGNYFKTSKAGPQELLIARLQNASLVARALSAVKRFGWLKIGHHEREMCLPVLPQQQFIQKHACHH